MTTIRFSPQQELAPTMPVSLDNVKQPQYGRYLEEYSPGQVFVHPRGFTFHRAQMDSFARTYMQMNPLYLNVEYAKSHGFENLLASPQMVFNVVLSLGVQNDSEKVVANLGYYNAQFLQPVYPGDTIEAMTMVVDRQEKGVDKPGIVTIRTLGLNQNKQVVLQYERKLMVRFRADKAPTVPLPNGAMPEFPWVNDASMALPAQLKPGHAHLTGWNTYADDFSVGDVIAHSCGRTISEEHYALTYQVGNTHPLHYDQIFSGALSGPMSGKPIIYGGLIYAWLEGLASRDISENAIAEIGFTEGYHTQPAVAGDTVAAISRVLAVEEAPGALSSLAKIITFQFIGIKNISSIDALKEYGEALFVKENTKKKMAMEKIPHKIFEIERRLLIKCRA